jgi:hypothetical protein
LPGSTTLKPRFGQRILKPIITLQIPKVAIGKKEISMLATTDRNLKARLDTATAGKMHFSGPTFNFGA